jgi:hypothetical protein
MNKILISIAATLLAVAFVATAALATAVPPAPINMVVKSDNATMYDTTGSGDYANATTCWTHPAWAKITIPGNWIWHSYYVTQQEALSGGSTTFQRDFEIPGCPSVGNIHITTDNSFTLYVNGHLAGSGNDWQTDYGFDISQYLQGGQNTVRIEAVNDPSPENPPSSDPTANPAGVIYSASIDYYPGECQSQIPEFGTIAALVALAGGVTTFIVMRKR